MVTVAHSAAIVGRDRERAALLDAVWAAGPLVTFVHGAAGIGKSTLARAFAHDAKQAGAQVVRLDCRLFEPTEQGFLAGVSGALDRPVAGAREAAVALASRGDVVVLVLDTYEVFRLSDQWLRSVFAPALDERVRLVIAGRESPISAWLDARGGPSRFRSLRLGALEDSDALELLERADVTGADARAINRVARGHPLALQVGGMALRERPDLRVEDAAVSRVVEELTRLYVAHLDRDLGRLLEAASVVRRVTAPLIAAMVAGVSVPEALERLASLPFVEEGLDGLRLHESVQSAVATRLRARDPEAHRRYRVAAWRTLRQEIAQAPRADLWRHTADMLYLLENPAVREAFFPTTAHLHTVEPARAEDAAAIRDMVERHEPPQVLPLLDAWWTMCRSAFRVVRDRSGSVVGLTVVIAADALPHRLGRADPVVAAWREHLRGHPLPPGQRAVFQRWELSRDDGEAPSAVQAAAWLDIKRLYMEMRPQLGRLYSLSADPDPYLDALTTLGFSIGTAPVRVGHDYTLLWLEFGPESVDGWLARLAANELGWKPESLLDAANREVVLDDQRVPLSPLEFGVLRHLLERKGQAVSRATLIEQVWGHSYLGGSNVVDVVIRSLRKKLGAKASVIETVRGVGYRFTG